MPKSPRAFKDYKRLLPPLFVEGGFSLDSYEQSPAMIMLSETFIGLALAAHFRGFFVCVEYLDDKYLATHWRLKIMAKKNARANSSNGIGEWKGFANIPFGAQDKDKALHWSKERDLWQEASDLVASDYKITLTVDQRSDAFVCSISCYDSDSPNYKHTMTSRAPTIDFALMVAIYKHIVIANGDWTEGVSAETWG